MRRTLTLEAEPAVFSMTGVEFMRYGNLYLDAAEFLSKRPPHVWFDPLPYQLLCQSLELHLKSFIWLTDRLSRSSIKSKYGHDIERLWRDAKDRRLASYCRLTPLRDQAIGLLGPYYKERKFSYLDISMSWEGIPKLRSSQDHRGTIARLCRQLRKSLRKPILEAS